MLDLNDSQNEIINSTFGSFKDVLNNVEEVSNKTDKLNEEVDGLTLNNQNIVKNISSLSAVSEEVTASASETLNVSEKDIVIAKDLENTLIELNNEAKKLK